MVTYAKLYQKDQTGKIRYWYMQQDENKYRSISGIQGREDTSEQVSEWTEVKEGTNIGKVNEKNPIVQATFLCDRMYTIRKEQGYAEDLKDAGKKFFQPMLAAKYFGLNEKKRNELFEGNVYIQPKLDGIRCIVTKDGMFSRHGKELLSAPHIRKSLDRVFDKYPDLILDGELYNHDLNEDFNQIISLARKTKPTEEDLKMSEQKIQYWIYDLPSCPKNFLDRNWELTNLFLDNKEFQKYCINVETNMVLSDEEVQHKLEYYLDKGYEGAIVRLNKPYENKRTNSLLKVKKFEDEEFRIVDIEEGRGNLAGKAGRIVVDVDGKRVSAGLKFSHDDAAEIWNKREYYIGKMATIKYFNRTPDGSLRFPKCIQIDRESYE